MNIDIANMALTIGEKTEGIDWFEHFVTFASVFAGAYFAYWFGVKLELRKAKRQMRADFCSFAAEVNLNFEELLRYKKVHLDALRKKHQEGKLSDISTMQSFPNVEISFDINKYVFLLDCNSAFISEIRALKTIENLLTSAWKDYQKCISEFLPHMKQNKQNLSALNIVFAHLYKTYNFFIVRMYFLNKHLSQCYERFFNVYYSNNIKEEYPNFETFEDDIKALLNNPEIQKWDKIFDKHWKPKRTFMSDIKFTYRKIKYNLEAIQTYFSGENKAKVDEKDK